MLLTNCLLAFLAPSIALSRASPAPKKPHSKKPHSKIHWEKCNATEVGTVSSPVKADCATWKVPLDYTNETKDTLDLQLARVHASKKHARGSILLNFGGPGVTARDGLLSFASELLLLSGGEWDLVAFDPRGTGNTIPFQCFETEEELDKYGKITNLLVNATDVERGNSWDEGGEIAALCAERMQATGSLIGTAFVARDLMAVVDALGEPGLRFWGFSYGTILGATAAAMFPDRIEAMILDGVANPHEYYHSPIDLEEFSYSDKVFSNFFTSCVEAGPEACALATLNKTASELEAAVIGAFDRLKFHPISFGFESIDYSRVKSTVFQALYDQANWSDLVSILKDLIAVDTERLAHKLLQIRRNTSNDLTPSDRHIESIGNQLRALLSIDAMAPSDMGISSTLGISCGDLDVRTDTLANFLPAIKKLDEETVLAGEANVIISIICTQWKFAAKERYAGDFQVKTRNPVLLVGNSLDIVTPITGARNVSEGLEGSVVLEVNGNSHTSMHLPSTCTLEHVSSYWKNGTLPMPGTICEVDARPFPLYPPGITWEDVAE